jgi:hypothetical protein
MQQSVQDHRRPRPEGKLMDNMRRANNGPFLSNRYSEPYEAWGSFVLAGATVNVPVFGGHIKSVTRIANATPTIAFRVELLDDLQGLGQGHLAAGDPRLNITASARGPNTGANDVGDYKVNALETGINPAVASPTFVTGRFIDIVVRNGAAAVDTAGIVVSFVIRGDRVDPDNR